MIPISTIGDGFLIASLNNSMEVSTGLVELAMLASLIELMYFFSNTCSLLGLMEMVFR